MQANRKRLKCQDIELVTADIIDYEIPTDVTIVYAFNPVRGELFAALVAALLGSLDRRPRRLRFVYTNPKEHETLMRTGRANLLRDYPPRFHRRYAVRIYDLLPAADRVDGGSGGGGGLP